MKRAQAYTNPHGFIDVSKMAADLVAIIKLTYMPRSEFLDRMGKLYDEIQIDLAYMPRSEFDTEGEA